MVGLVLRRVVKGRVRTLAALGVAALALGLVAGGCGGTNETYIAAGGSAGVASGSGGDGDDGRVAGTGGTSGNNSTEGGFGGSRAGSPGSGAVGNVGGLPPVGGTAGSIGRGGTFNFGGFPQAGGGGGGAPPTPSTRLGQSCVNDTECEAATTGLTCLRQDGTMLDGGGPPGGMCSVECGVHETCWAIDANSLCVAFGSTAYCVEGCLQGPPMSLLDPPKCHLRPDFSCTPLDTFPTGSTCVNYLDCLAGEACYAGECVVVLSACLPTCAGDIDCPSGTFCDREFGTCKPGSTAGLPLGSACDPLAASDPCLGFCQAASGVPNLDGTCAEICSYLNPCSWDEGTDYGGICLIPTAVNENADIGDFGYCSELCDCSSDCTTPSYGCVPVDGLQEYIGRPGVCWYPFEADGTPSLTLECP